MINKLFIDITSIQFQIHLFLFKYFVIKHFAHWNIIFSLFFNNEETIIKQFGWMEKIFHVLFFYCFLKTRKLLSTILTIPMNNLTHQRKLMIIVGYFFMMNMKQVVMFKIIPYITVPRNVP